MMGQSNPMRDERMKEVPLAEEHTLSKRIKSSEVVCANDGGKVSAPDFKDAGSFIGGKIDGALDQANPAGVSVQKGSGSVQKPSLEKGSSGPGS